jgi:hypothetical protein
VAPAFLERQIDHSIVQFGLSRAENQQFQVFDQSTDACSHLLRKHNSLKGPSARLPFCGQVQKVIVLSEEQAIKASGARQQDVVVHFTRPVILAGQRTTPRRRKASVIAMGTCTSMYSPRIISRTFRGSALEQLRA